MHPILVHAYTRVYLHGLLLLQVRLSREKEVSAETESLQVELAEMRRAGGKVMDQYAVERQHNYEQLTGDMKR